MNIGYYKNQVIEACSEYASIAHTGQFRKDKTTPYIVHPARVACWTTYCLRNHAELYLYIAAAWLHDVMEDCSEITHKEYSTTIRNHTGKDKDIYRFLTEHETIIREDGIRIFAIVDALTKSQNKNAPKKDRERTYFRKVKQAGPEVSIVKCCDRLDNLTTAHVFTKDGFEWYLTETKLLIDILRLNEYVLFTPVHNLLKEQLKGAKDKFNEMYE